MNDLTRKWLRTLQVRFPRSQSSKYRVKRAYLNLRKHPSEPDFKALSLFPDREGQLYLDVGANRGQSTDALLLAAKTSRIESFEPNPLLSQRLKSLYCKHPSVTINSFGLGNVSQQVHLYVPCYGNWTFDGLASLKRSDAENALDNQLFFFKKSHFTVREMECHIRPLDELGTTPFFIKIDVEGCELEVLQGGQGTIAANEPILLVESPEADTRALLTRLGYQHYAYAGGRFHEGQLGRRNTFFMTPLRADTVREHIVTASHAA